jgi:membrane-associated phospholipid phosphatase
MIRKTCIFFLLAFSVVTARSQSASTLPSAPDANPEDAPTLRNLPMNFLRDQGAIWTSPLHLNEKRALGAVILVGATTVLITTDHQVMSEHLHDASMNHDSELASTGLTGMFLAAPVAFYGMGAFKGSEKAKETGVLGGQAILSSVAVSEVIKIISRRERPTVNGAKGEFFQPNVNFDSSFASNHSVIAWSSATVVASEYHGWLTQTLAYGLATGVSLTRVTSRNHFPSDVMVGSAVGWMIGRYVYHRHHREHVLLSLK